MVRLRKYVLTLGPSGPVSPGNPDGPSLPGGPLKTEIIFFILMLYPSAMWLYYPLNQFLKVIF